MERQTGNAVWDAVVAAIEKKRAATEGRLLVAIDGRCGAGKTTLAAYLAERLGCTVFHMDDFFLRPEQRTPARYDTPGGNVDYERFDCEVLSPLRRGAGQVTYRPFSCAAQQLGAPVTVEAAPLVVVEGSYSCHPALWESYDLRVFLSVAPAEQRRRILRRSGEARAASFVQRWIPLEERYFEAFHIARRADLRLET